MRRVCTELWLKWGFLRRVFRWELVFESPNTSAVGTLESRRPPETAGLESVAQNKDSKTIAEQ